MSKTFNFREHPEVLSKINELRGQLFGQLPAVPEKNIHNFDGGAVIEVVADEKSATKRMEFRNFDSTKWSRKSVDPIQRVPRWTRITHGFNPPRIIE